MCLELHRLSKLFLSCAFGLLLARGICWGQLYTISTIAGGVPPPTPIAAVNASVGEPLGVAADTAGNVYIASDNCIFKVDTSGVMTRFAGTSRAGYSGDGGPATEAQLNSPTSVAFDNAGNTYIADYTNHRLRKVSSSGVITTVAGGGGSPYPNEDGIPATSSSLFPVLGVAVDGAGTPYFSEQGGNRIRKVPPNGVIGTAAGNGTLGKSGDGGPATSAQLSRPYGVAFDKTGNLYIADPVYGAIRRVTPDGIISTFLQMPSPSGPTGLAVDSAGNLYIADQWNNLVLKVSSGGTVTTVAGNGTAGFSGDGGAAAAAQLNAPRGVAVDAAGSLYIADALNSRIRKVSSDGIITTLAGNGSLSYSGDGGLAANAQLSGPRGLAVDGSGNLFIADFDNNMVRKISASGIIITVAGNGVAGFSGDSGRATSAQLNGPWGVAVDRTGNLFIADSANNRIRRVSPSGIITTVAGNGSSPPDSFTPTVVGDGGPAISAELSHPSGLAVDTAGNLYIADTYDNAIRKVSLNGVISTVTSGGYGGHGDPNDPTSIAIDSSGDLFVGGSVFEVSAQGTTSNTVYGRRIFGNPVAVDSAGNLFFADCLARVGKLSRNGIQSTIAGTCDFGDNGYSGDGGPGLNARLSGNPETDQGSPLGMAVDAAGNVYVADTGNNAIRLLQPTSHPSLIGAVVDAASEGAGPVSPGKIVVIYGAGFGPAQLAQFQVANGRIGTQLAGTSVSFNGTPAPVIYTSATQVAAIVPYEASGGAAQVIVTYHGQSSPPFAVPLAASAPTLFTLNQTGAGQAAAVNRDGTVNTAANPVKIGDYISLYATGEGRTSPSGIDGKIASVPLPHPVLPVTVTIDGQPARVTYHGAAPGEVSGLMQVNVQVPSGVQAGGYVPVVLHVGNTTSQDGVTIAVSK